MTNNMPCPRKLRGQVRALKRKDPQLGKCCRIRHEVKEVCLGNDQQPLK